MSDGLTLTPNFQAADDFYAALMDALTNLSEAEVAAFNARLVLVLANHVGQQDVLLAALAAARDPQRPD